MSAQLATLRSRLDAWAAGAKTPTRLIASIVGPLAIFGLILGGVAIDDPLGFTIFGVVTVAVLWVLARAGVIKTLRGLASANSRVTAALTLVLVFLFPLTQ